MNVLEESRAGREVVQEGMHGADPHTPPSPEFWNKVLREKLVCSFQEAFSSLFEDRNDVGPLPS